MSALIENSLRLPAEWEPQGAVLVAWPHENTDWNYMLSEAQECYESLIKAISRFAIAIVIAPDTSGVRERLKEIPADRIVFFDVPTNDTWTRDYGVISTIDGNNLWHLNDFAFNAWGGKFKSEFDNAVTGRMYEAGLLRGIYEDNLDFVLEGGSIESDGFGTILTTSSCLLTPTRNKGYKREDIEYKLKTTLGAKKVLWLETGEIIGDDTDGHIDTIARLAPHDTILYCGAGWNMENDGQSKALKGVGETLALFTNAEGRPFNLVELPMPDAIYDPDDGHRLPATYANFLIINNAVLLPVYGQQRNDENAIMSLRVAFPEHEIVPIDCRAMIRQHGSLHCATMQIPAEILPL